MAKRENVIILMMMMMMMMVMYVQQKIFYDYICICYLAMYVRYTKVLGVGTNKNVTFTFVHGLQSQEFSKH